MKIRDIKTLVVNAGMRNWIFVKVVTDEGIVGWGEATLEWKTNGVCGTIEDLKPLLIGKNPLDITFLVEIMTKHSFWQLGAIGKSAISGIEIALWDIMGKALNKPIWQLLGGKVRDKVRLYTHLGFGDSGSVYSPGSNGLLRDQALRIVESGYKALKIVPVPYVNYTASLSQLKLVDKMIEEVRLAVGDDVDIMVDFHGRPGSASAAVQFIEVLEPYSPLFVEEVIQPGEVEALKKIKEKTNVPIATGERIVSVKDFEPLFQERVIDIAQPDLCHIGGFTEVKKVASMAALAGVGIAPHNPLGPIAGIAALHFDIATPNFVIQERMDSIGWFYEVVPNQPAIKNGYWEIPNLPGLGVEVDEAVASRHPYVPDDVSYIQSATIEDGTIVHW